MKKLLSILALTAGLSLNAVPTKKHTITVNTHKKMEMKTDYMLPTQVAPAPIIHNNATTKVTFKPGRPHALMKTISKMPTNATATMGPIDGVVLKGYHIDKNGQTEMVLELTNCQEPFIVAAIFENFSEETVKEATSGSFDKNTEFLYVLTFTNDAPSAPSAATSTAPRKSSRK